ncbi:polysaccharide biosynthesis protein [Flavobacterium sp. PL12]|uniref:polysaccharide biosynthesis protein n=1 Tax=Flavobacterium sp. PL12 TaxID=3071718 RepID=UPI00319E0847
MCAFTATSRLKEKGTNATKFFTTRFGNVLGSNGSIVSLFTKHIAEGGLLTITHNDIITYFVTIPKAYKLVLQAGAIGK